MDTRVKEEKGITLIALIVTIIVLLILAMVSVNLILRENLIRKAQSAKEEYELAAQNEALALDYFEREVNKYIPDPDLEPEIEVDDDVIANILFGLLGGTLDTDTAVYQMKAELKITDQNIYRIEDMAIPFQNEGLQYAYVYKVDRLYKLNSTGDGVIYGEESENAAQYTIGRKIKSIKTDLENFYINKPVVATTQSEFEGKKEEINTNLINGCSNIISANAQWSSDKLLIEDIAGTNVSGLRADVYYETKTDGTRIYNRLSLYFPPA